MAFGIFLFMGRFHYNRRGYGNSWQLCIHNQKPLLGVCNSRNKPIQRHFYRLVFFFRYFVPRHIGQFEFQTTCARFGKDNTMRPYVNMSRSCRLAKWFLSMHILILNRCHNFEQILHLNQMTRRYQYFCFWLFSHSSIRYYFSLPLEVQILKPLEISYSCARPNRTLTGNLWSHGISKLTWVALETKSSFC